jgi:hypothetical protein
MKKEFRGALNIVLVYIGIGVLWILVSDFIEQRLVAVMPGVEWIQTAKGIFYVCITGILLFMLIYRYMKRQDLYYQLLHDKNRLLQSVLDNQKDTNILVVDRAMDILIDLGADNLFGIENGVRFYFKNITDLKDHLSWFELLNNAIIATWRNDSFQSQLTIRGVSYDLSAKVLQVHPNSMPVVLLIFVQSKK